MKIQCLTSDIINTLPQNIVDNILTLMPIRDALRASILSKKWRYRWKSMPKLAFDDNHVEEPCFGKLEIYELVNAIFHVLLLHKGPLVEFEFSARGLPIRSEFDLIILYLSRINNVKILIFVFFIEYKLPHSFFSLNGLEVLKLENCDFDPPITFNGFGKLQRMFFWNVEIKAKALLHFLANCPLLEEVILNGCFQENFESEGGNEFTFVELLWCVPLVTTLNISKYYMKILEAFKARMDRCFAAQEARMDCFYAEIKGLLKAPEDKSEVEEKHIEDKSHGEENKTYIIGQLVLSGQGMRACEMEDIIEKVLQSVSPPNKKIEADECLRETPDYLNSLQSATRLSRGWLHETKTETRDLDQKHVDMDIVVRTQDSSGQKTGYKDTGREGKTLAVEGDLRDNESNGDHLGSYNSHGDRRMKIEDHYPWDPGITQGYVF